LAWVAPVLAELVGSGIALGTDCSMKQVIMP
jgi:hypothetical protein